MIEHKDPPTSLLTRQQQDWFDAGARAYHAGTSRDDYPFPEALRRADLDVCWQIGWDTGRLQASFAAGRAAQPGDPCPYSEPELAAQWVIGWKETHGLQAVRKDPALRGQDAAPDVAK